MAARRRLVGMASRVALSLLVVGSALYSQSLSPSTPDVLYVRFGGEVVALEYNPNVPVAELLKPKLQREVRSPNFLLDSPFQERQWQHSPDYVAVWLRGPGGLEKSRKDGLSRSDNPKGEGK